MCKKKSIITHNGKQYPDDSKLIADHIVPIAMGGEMWDIKNLQTLCIKCNKIKTKYDHKYIAYYKKGKIAKRTKQLLIIEG